MRAYPDVTEKGEIGRGKVVRSSCWFPDIDISTLHAHFASFPDSFVDCLWYVRI